MYNNKKILALIPARGGSKGIKDKNIRDLNGMPLIAYTINAAKRSKYVDAVVVTTDSDKIAVVSKEYGASIPFMRPAELAQDKSKSIDSLVYTFNRLKDEGKHYDVVVLLQPTSPLRDNVDIDNSIIHFFEMGEEGLVSVSPVNDSPILVRTIDDKGKNINLLNVSSTCRRQDMPNYYRVNGAIYI